MIYCCCCLSKKGDIKLTQLESKTIEYLAQRKGKHVLRLFKSRVNKQEQLNFFEYLAMTYVPGLSLYTTLRNYIQQSNRSRHWKYLMISLQRGKSFSQITDEYFDGAKQYKGVLYLLVDRSDWEGVSSLIMNHAEDSRKISSNALEKLAYPGILLVSLCVTWVYFCLQVFPSMSQFSSANTSSTFFPLLFNIKFVALLYSLTLGIILIGFIIFKKLPPTALVRIPVYGKICTLRLEQILNKLLEISTKDQRSLCDLIEAVLRETKDKLEVYYLSTIYYRQKQGKSLQSSLQSELWKKSELLMALAIPDKQKRIQYFYKQYAYKRVNMNKHYSRAFSLGATLLYTTSAIILFLLSLVMLYPLQALSTQL